MFQGFSERTLDFFLAIRYNNNPTFFHENHAWYVEAARDPMRELAAALSPAIDQLDPELECRPEKIVSRLNRDIRFTKDKSPYRDHLWLDFHRNGERRHISLCVYFEITPEYADYGIGIYDEYRPFTNGLRYCLEHDEENFLNAWLPVKDEFRLGGARFKRLSIPEQLHEESKLWYPAKGFFLSKDVTDYPLLFSPALVDEIAGGIERLTPLYRWLSAVPEMN